jgi:hypothetical protein
MRRVQKRFDASDAAYDAGEAGGPAAAAGATGAPRAPGAATSAARRPRILAPVPGLRLPPARISALLVVAFLGFGILIGDAAGPHVSGTLAASAQRLHVVLAPSRPAPSSSGGGSPSSTSEPPEAEAQPTPEPAAEAASSATATTPAPSHAPAPAPAASGEQQAPGSSPSASAPAAPSKLPPIKHVFVIMLSDQPYAALFGPESAAHYLAGTLEPRGELLVRYDAVAHEQLANELALLSGQGPTQQTAANCPVYADVVPATPGADEQVLGAGCVYPAATKTLGSQLGARHLLWRSYVEGFGEPGAPAGACGHPPLGSADPTAAATPAGEAYATFRNPFLYFHSVIDSPACARADVGIDQLRPDLAAPSRTPSFSYIVPDRCHDADPLPCRPGAPAGPAAADTFLKQVVPQITGSRAYRDSGLLVVTADEAPSGGEFADSSSCCGQPQFPNIAPGPAGLAPRGGGAVGALLLSPFIKGGATSQEPYNHFSLLRTTEDLFGLRHLGYAARGAVKPFEPAMFNASRKR